MNESILIVLNGYLILFFLQTALWLIQLFTKDASTADVGWSVGMSLLVGWYALNLQGNIVREQLILIPLIIWTLRLSSHLIGRIIRDGHEDSRYAQLREEWGRDAWRNFFLIYQLQPVLNVVLSVPFFLICLNAEPSMHWVEVSALLLWCAGLAGETVADNQLKAFKQNPDNRGKICQVGLWQYSRHPNFFFEWVMWVSYSLYALGSPYGILGVVSPALMLFLLLKVTGIPIMEKRALERKGQAFREYMERTSIFVPLPRKSQS